MEQFKLSSGKEITVKEIKYKEFTALQGLDQTQGAKELLKLSTGLTDEEYDNLGLKEGIDLMQVVIKVNGLGDAGNFRKN